MYRTREGVHGDVNVLESPKLGDVRHVCLPHLVAAQPTGIDPSMHSWHCMSLAAGTSRHNGPGLVSGDVEPSDQTKRILMEQLMADPGLLEDVRQRSYRSRGSEGVSPPVTLLDKPQQFRVRLRVHHVKWMLSVGD
ncbi:hypothetical protein HGM15179_020695 [Zosterops borbonicus]|uniref:Uncharacterized protein n=1 Tax=Zosterops borbonicus TaxID=364589 RepID=A0A8K1FYC2_9PASS|nr:hypothetical protein HGM15179_020695 [Zosterops borbonicus]